MGNLQDKVQDAKAWWKSKTVIGTILFIAPMIVKMIAPDLDINLEAGTDEVFNQADLIASQTDALWMTLSDTIGKVLIALGLRDAAVSRKSLKIF